MSPLLTRIDTKQIEAMIENSKESLAATDAAAVPPPPQPSRRRERRARAARQRPIPVASVTPAPRTGRHRCHANRKPRPTISIDDFAKLDLRIGKVLHCEFVEGSDKLLRFELDGGELGKRQIFSGIRAAYQEPQKLIGRSVVFIANLAPRKMRFGVSEGMILSAGSGGGELFLLDVDGGAQPGMPVK